MYDVGVSIINIKIDRYIILYRCPKLVSMYEEQFKNTMYNIYREKNVHHDNLRKIRKMFDSLNT